MKLPCQNVKNLFGTKNKTKGQLDVSIKGNFKAGDWSQAVTFLNIPSEWYVTSFNIVFSYENNHFLKQCQGKVFLFKTIAKTKKMCKMNYRIK